MIRGLGGFAYCNYMVAVGVDDRNETFRRPRRRRPRLAQGEAPTSRSRATTMWSGWAGARSASGTTGEIAAKSGFPPPPRGHGDHHLRPRRRHHPPGFAGNKGRTEAGDVQVMSAGTACATPSTTSRATPPIFQIWILPSSAAAPRSGAPSVSKATGRRFVHAGSVSTPTEEALLIARRRGGGRTIAAAHGSYDLGAGAMPTWSLEGVVEVTACGSSARRRRDQDELVVSVRRSRTPRSCWSTRPRIPGTCHPGRRAAPIRAQRSLLSSRQPTVPA